MKSPTRYIVVSGSIGVGKTTLSKRIAEQLPSSQYFQEKGEDNPFLDLFYSDMKTWGFHNKIAFLDIHTKAYLQVDDATKYVILDRSIHEVEVFSKLHQEITSSELEKESVLYWSLYKTLSYFAPKPSVVIYLKCPVDIALKRIIARGHGYEKNISLEYLTLLQKYYDEWILKKYSSSQVLYLDTDQINVKQDPIDNVIAFIFSEIERNEP